MWQLRWCCDKLKQKFLTSQNCFDIAQGQHLASGLVSAPRVTSRRVSTSAVSENVRPALLAAHRALLYFFCNFAMIARR